MMRICLAIFLILIFSSSAFSKEVPPIQVAAEFYKWAIRHDGGGLPKEPQLKSLKKFLSIDLVYLLRASSAAEERCIALTPIGQKPLVFEGSLFVGFYEGLTKVISLREKKIGEKTIISTRLGYDNPKVLTDTHNWLDTVTMIQENDKWVISDFNSVGSKATLVGTLKKYISKDECGI
jgi:hypothetical protein